MYVYIYIYIYIYTYVSNNTDRGYCLDIPRCEESPNDQTRRKETFSRNKVSDSKNG